MKKGMCIAGIVVLAMLVLTGFASAETLTDDTNDVWHWKWHENLGTYEWAHSVTSKPNIDITELSYTIEDHQITFKVKVKGTIENSEKVVYIASYNATDAIYWMTYANGEGTCWGFSDDYSQMTSENVTASDDTISVTVDMVGTGPKEEFWGYAAEYTGEPMDESAEWWGDWAPQDTSLWYGIDGGNGDDDEGGGIPGFEFVFLVIAIAIISLKRRKQK